MLSHIKDIIPGADKDDYAIGAFNTFNLEVTQGIIRGAVAKCAPIIIQVSETTIKYAGLKPITHIVSTIAKNESNNIPVALHLDHGHDFHSVVECVRAGFSSVHMDGSELAFDENIEVTKQAVDYAHKNGVWAQGELGRIIGVYKEATKYRETKSEYTDPDQAREFVAKTGIDTLAISIGNSHGLADDTLDFDRLKEINKKVDVPLVLHGGSGIRKEYVKRAIGLGIVVVNIDTDLRMAFSDAAEKSFSERNHKDEYDPRKLLAPARDAVQNKVEEDLETFGACNKGMEFQKEIKIQNEKNKTRN